MISRLSLSTKLLVGAALALLPLLALLVLDSVEDHRLRRQQLLTAQLDTARAVSALVDTIFGEAAGVAEVVAAAPAVQPMSPRLAEGYFERIASIYPQFDAVVLFDAEGRMVVSSKPPLAVEEVDISDRPYFRRLLATGEPVLSDFVISRLTGRPIVVAAAPVEGPGGDIRGVVDVTLDAERLGEELVAPGLGGGPTSIVLVSPAGRLAFHSAFPEVMFELRDRSQLLPVREARRAGAFVGEYRSPLFEDGRLGAYVETRQYGWVVGVTRSASEAFAPLRWAVLLRALAFLFIVALSTGLAVVAARRIAGPIQDLTREASKLGEGNYAARVAVAAGDEVGTLAQTFNRMAASLEETHDALRQANGELMAVLDNVDAAILVVDAAGRVRYLNRNLAEWFGVEPGGALGRDAVEVFSRGAAARTAAPDSLLASLRAPCSSDGRASREPVELVSPRPRHLVRYCAPVSDEEGNLLGRVDAYHDQTEQIRTEQMRDEFLSVAAHELKTPITAIKGFSQLLLRGDAVASDSGRDHLKTIDRQCDRLRRLADDLLQVARLRIGKLSMRRERVDLAALAAAAAGRWGQSQPQRRIELQAERPVEVEADPQRLLQVVENLVDNAFKYSSPDRPVTLRVEKSEGRARLSVIDRGIGIPREKQEGIFEPFFRAHAGTERDAGGLGIGLFLSRRIAEQHEGTLGFESRLGRGSTFTLTLPLAAGTATEGSGAA